MLMSCAIFAAGRPEGTSGKKKLEKNVLQKK